MAKMGVSTGERRRGDTIVRVVLGVLGLVSLELGVWATFAPRSFYDDFPGSGRHWVSIDGPYNEHFVRDFGGLNLALALLALVTVVKFTPTLVRTAAGAFALFGVPHFVYHMRHLGVFTADSDKAANIVTLGLSAVAPLLVLGWSFRKERPTSSS